MNEPSPIQMMLLMQNKEYRERMERSEAFARQVIDMIPKTPSSNPPNPSGTALYTA